LLASLSAETTPATRPVLAEEASPGVTRVAEGDAIDLNEDGFITLDEMIVLARSGLGGGEIARRLVRSGYVLGATSPQVRHLRAMGVPEEAIAPLVSEVARP
jgi:hypothetical protein